MNACAWVSRYLYVTLFLSLHPYPFMQLIECICWHVHTIECVSYSCTNSKTIVFFEWCRVTALYYLSDWWHLISMYSYFLIAKLPFNVERRFYYSIPFRLWLNDTALLRVPQIAFRGQWHALITRSATSLVHPTWNEKTQTGQVSVLCCLMYVHLPLCLRKKMSL